MQGLASFDRWLTGRAAPQIGRTAAPARSAAVPALTRYLVDPAQQAVATVEREAGPAALLRAAHRIGPDDWLGLLADDTQTRGCSQRWRLALWRRGEAPQWLAAPIGARPGQAAAALRRAALEQAVQALWNNGWRLVDAAAAPAERRS